MYNNLSNVIAAGFVDVFLVTPLEQQGKSLTPQEKQSAITNLTSVLEGVYGYGYANAQLCCASKVMDAASKKSFLTSEELCTIAQSIKDGLDIK